MAVDPPPSLHFEQPYYMSQSDAARYMRSRPSPDQAEELQKLYIINPFPTIEERQALAQRIRM